MAVNDQHITAIATIAQDILLLLSAVLIGGYLWETRKLRKAAENQVNASLGQVEATWRPAIVAKPGGSTAEAPVLENIGNGPALDVRWSLSNSNVNGVIAYMKPHVAMSLPIGGVKPLYEAGTKSGSHSASIECMYRSLSGWSYSSTSEYDFHHDRFSATFSPGRPDQE